MCCSISHCFSFLFFFVGCRHNYTDYSGRFSHHDIIECTGLAPFPFSFLLSAVFSFLFFSFRERVQILRGVDTGEPGEEGVGKFERALWRTTRRGEGKTPKELDKRYDSCWQHTTHVPGEGGDCFVTQGRLERVAVRCLQCGVSSGRAKKKKRKKWEALMERGRSNLCVLF